MVAVDDDRPAARSHPNLGVSLLPVAAIYGPNASGKSNVLAAIEWFQEAIRDSLRFWDDGIPPQPFAFDNTSRRSEFTVESVVSGVRFEYVLELDSEAIHYEGLFHYPEKKRRRIFEREGSELVLQRGLGHLSGIRELLTDRALALSVARRFDEPLVSNFVGNLLRAQVLGQHTSPRSVRRVHSGSHTRRWFEYQADSDQTVLPELEDVVGRNEADRAEAVAMLRMADLGIDDPFLPH